MANPVSKETMIEWRDELQTRLDALKQEQADIERKLTAISLYLSAVRGEVPNPKLPTPAKPAPTKAPRVKRRGHILDILRQKPEGYSFDEIVEIMNVTDKHEKDAIYAALQNMKRKAEIVQHPNKHFVIAETKLGEHEPGVLEPVEAKKSE